VSESCLIYINGVWEGECDEYALSMPDCAFKEAVEAWLRVRNVPYPTLRQRLVAAEHCSKLSYWIGFWKYPFCGVTIAFK